MFIIGIVVRIVIGYEYEENINYYVEIGDMIKLECASGVCM